LETNLIILIKGLIVGIFVSLPSGPAGLYSIRKTLEHGWLTGFISCLGIVTVDLIYASIAGLGMYTIVSFLEVHHTVVGLFGGLFIIFVGIRSFRRKSTRQANLVIDGLPKFYFKSLIISLTNPLIIIVYMAIFSGIGLTDFSQNHIQSLTLLSGIALGATATWLLISILVNEFRKKIHGDMISSISRISSIILIIIGLVIIIKSIYLI
jgi:threonine/homoserine/homoserine lactone efflux protein